MKDLGSGLYSIIAGDASNDGQVDSDDRATTWNNRNMVTQLPEYLKINKK
jgi:hypothetical protein